MSVQKDLWQGGAHFQAAFKGSRGTSKTRSIWILPDRILPESAFRSGSKTNSQVPYFEFVMKFFLWTPMRYRLHTKHAPKAPHSPLLNASSEFRRSRQSLLVAFSGDRPANCRSPTSLHPHGSSLGGGGNDPGRASAGKSGALSSTSSGESSRAESARIWEGGRQEMNRFRKSPLPEKEVVLKDAPARKRAAIPPNGSDIRFGDVQSLLRIIAQHPPYFDHTNCPPLRLHARG